MNETVREWLSKAADDYRVARREFDADPDPSYDAACFHAQQSVEKLMKAALVSAQVLAPRTHDLITLSRLVTSSYPGWGWDEADLKWLSLAAAQYRYPGESADRDDAERALSVCTALRKRLLEVIAAC